MTAVTRSMFFWPGWRQLGFATLLGLAELALFEIVYGGTNWITGQHRWRIPLHTPIDLEIPFVPAMTVVYLSLNPLFWMLAFILRTRQQTANFVGTLAATTIIAGGFFLLLPASHAFTRPSSAELGGWLAPYEIMRAVALEYNYLPSLHVAFTTICVRVAQRFANPFEKVILLAWGLAIIISTLLTHQHYLIDVFTGLLLGWFAVTFGYDRWLGQSRERAEQTSHPTPSSDQGTSA